MIALDEDALICDLAETYNIYDYKGLPLHTVATLSCGLRETSRIKQKITGVNVTQTDQLLSICADKLSWLVWAKTESAQKNEGMPKSIYKALMNMKEDSDREDVEAFNSPEAFEERLRSIREGG